MGRAEETLLQHLSRAPRRAGVPPRRLTTWPSVLWAGARRDGGREKYGGVGREESFQISFITVWVTFPVCTSSCTQTHFLSNMLCHFFFLWNSLMLWFIFENAPFSFVLDESLLFCAYSLIFPGKCSVRDTLFSYHTAGVLLSVNRIYYVLFINDAGLLRYKCSVLH